LLLLLLLFLPLLVNPNQRTVISAEAAHGPIVSSAAKKSTFGFCPLLFSCHPSPQAEDLLLVLV
jgi:hypothetical protein